MTDYYSFYAHIWYALRTLRSGDWTSLFANVGEVLIQILSVVIVNKQMTKFVNKLSFMFDLYLD